MQQVYSLEQVLEFKRRLEEREREKLAHAELMKREQTERLNTLLDVMEEQFSSTASVLSIEHRGQYWSLQLKRIEDARHSLQEVQLERDHAQASLLAAAVERKKFEIHKDSEISQKNLLSLQAEQKMLDECALVAFLRQKERK